MSVRADRQAVVVGADGSTSALNAVRWAAYLAHSLRAPLSITHAEPISENRFDDEKSRANQLGSPDWPESAQTIIDQAVGVVHTCADHLRVLTDLCPGPADAALIDRSRRARFLVVGLHTAPGSNLLGRTTIHVVTRAHCPVVVWRGAAGHPIPRDHPIVVAVDGTTLSEPAIAHAFELAAAFDAPLRAIHVRAPGIDLLRGGGEAQEGAVLSESLAGMREKYPDVAVSESVLPGAAVPVLTTAATDAQLLVVGSRARRSAAAVLLGSTSRDLLHRTPCPVLVCPERQ
ncbi:universal stress protein [Nocardia mexicana]|uniref:Nucleotide-binding universal stress UspA family protein n=1 Tax=Nocardia mexicana TaxID=279262 RepID=A0A370H5U2_9NOCA|nr:universal stress protein [Nocardia mexicana]RDI51128.1 nucleotide-binding universal stress UspA family protein [Nocardia mexicana]